MNVYIASSWKNRHAVEMLTTLLRDRGITVHSFIENNGMENHVADFEAWIKTPAATDCFFCDMKDATHSDLVIYIGPSGSDAWAEVGAAFVAGVHVLGLLAKGEQIGLMRKCMDHWYDDYRKLLEDIERIINVQG